MTFKELVEGFGKLTGGSAGVWPDALVGPALRTAVWGVGGGLAGRYLLAPALRGATLNYGNEDVINRNAAIIGALTGGLASGVPAYYEHQGKELNDMFKQSSLLAYNEKNAELDPWFMSRPSIPISGTVEDIRENPWMSFTDKLTAQNKLLEATQRQGSASAGLLRPASLIDFAAQTALNSAPYVLSAIGLSKVLGLPDKVKDTGVGAGLLAGAWKTYLNNSN